MPWLQLIRWKNLLIICFTQWVAWRCVIAAPNPDALTRNNFFFLTLSTTLIAAAGYIINDYFDRAIDAVNKPGKVIVGRIVSVNVAFSLYVVLNAAAISLAAIVAFKAHHVEWLLLQFACIILLWFYSTHFKRQYMIGNLVVSLLAALTILVLVVYKPAISMPQANTGHSTVLAGFAFFAFMLTWMREIVKDMEDVEGDAQYHCQTMPLKSGMKFSARFTKVLCAVTLVILLAFDYKLLLVAVPLIVWALRFSGNKTRQQYHAASRQLKFIMLLGACSLIFYFHG